VSHRVAPEQEAACLSGTTPPSLRDLRAATARRQRVLWAQRQRASAIRGPQRRGGTVSIRAQRQLSTAILRVTRDGTQRTFRSRECRSNAPLRVWRIDGPGPAGLHRVWFSERSAEHDGPGSTCPPGKRGTQLRGLRSATLCNLRVRWRNVPTSAALCGAEEVGERASLDIPGREKRVHRGATVLVHRTLAGATG
jgi:hypothetical protein